MKLKPIKIDRQWIGAPETHSNPTVMLFVIAVGGYGLGVTGLATGQLPVIAGVPWLAICLYIGFSVMHEAMHGIAHRSKSVGNVMGRVCALMLMLSMPLFQGVHHAHHGHTNDPERDPDLIVAWGPAWLRPITLLAVVPTYHWHFYRSRLWRDRAALREAVATDVALLIFLGMSVASGVGSWLVTLWIAPLILTSLWLSFAFDYLPHYPHSTQGRYFDTRVYPGRIANVLFLGQNYHLIHHLWTTIPWYRYQAVYASIEPELHERGCAIGWTSRAENPESDASILRDTRESDDVREAQSFVDAGQRQISSHMSAHAN